MQKNLVFTAGVAFVLLSLLTSQPHSQAHPHAGAQDGRRRRRGVALLHRRGSAEQRFHGGHRADDHLQPEPSLSDTPRACTQPLGVQLAVALRVSVG